ncbi:hypothetical protein ACF1AJ_02745 [Leifsonia sp. NPDC014704]|uniref:hypothetical protein n=1 Tax=Leifsonia sp. NPDC014704 TaxID=3364123 RepID=UPI0036F477B5
MRVAVLVTAVVSLLGVCTSVPALRDPVPYSASGPQKTIAELLTQWADLTSAAIAATAHIDEWTDDTPLAKSKPWDPAVGNVSLAPYATTASDDAFQVTAVVFHAPFEHDPHPIANKLTAHGESQGFTVTRTIDSTTGTDWMAVEMRAERADGVEYGLTATTETVAIDVFTECSRIRRSAAGRASGRCVI